MAHPFKKQTRKGGAPSVVKLGVLHPSIPPLLWDERWVTLLCFFLLYDFAALTIFTFAGPAPQAPGRLVAYSQGL
jgi:hypothetical protein